jgi:hypothetical protein
VHRVAVDRVDVALFVVVEKGISPEGAGADDVLLGVSKPFELGCSPTKY